MKATDKLKSIVGANEYVGIDVPVLLRPGGAVVKGTVFIVGLSPLRAKKDFDSPHDVLLGTPFAVHQMWGCPRQCDVYKQICNDLLETGYAVYLTDITKVCCQGEIQQNEKAEGELIRKELEIVGQDSVIVAWGQRAAGRLKKAGLMCHEQLHPGKNNWTNWKLSILRKVIDDANIKDPTKSDDLRTDTIVAQEAIREILSFAGKH